MRARINQQFFPPSAEYDVHNVMTFTIGSQVTPLHAAARGNQPQIVKRLIEAGADPGMRGGYDDAMPLHLAAWHDCADAAQALIDGGADLNARSGRLHNNSPAGWAIVGGSARVFETLIRAGAAILPHFQRDALAGVSGQFDNYSAATGEARQRILTLLAG